MRTLSFLFLIFFSINSFATTSGVMDLGTNVFPSNASPVGAAGGDLTGNYPNPTILGVAGTAFTPTISGANQGNIGIASGLYWVGKGNSSGYVMIDFYVDVTGTLGSGAVVTVTLPNSYTINTALDPNPGSTTNAGATHYGFCSFFQAGTGWKAVSARYSSSTKIQFAEAPGYLTDTEFVFSGQRSSIQCVGLRIPVN